MHLVVFNSALILDKIKIVIQHTTMQILTNLCFSRLTTWKQNFSFFIKWLLFDHQTRQYSFQPCLFRSSFVEDFKLSGRAARWSVLFSRLDCKLSCTPSSRRRWHRGEEIPPRQQQRWLSISHVSTLMHPLIRNSSLRPRISLLQGSPAQGRMWKEFPRMGCM